MHHFKGFGLKLSLILCRYLNNKLGTLLNFAYYICSAKHLNCCCKQGFEIWIFITVRQS